MTQPAPPRDRMTAIELANALSTCLEMLSVIKPLEKLGLDFEAQKRDIATQVTLLTNGQGGPPHGPDVMAQWLLNMQAALMTAMEAASSAAQ